MGKFSTLLTRHRSGSKQALTTCSADTSPGSPNLHSYLSSSQSMLMQPMSSSFDNPSLRPIVVPRRPHDHEPGRYDHDVLRYRPAQTPRLATLPMPRSVLPPSVSGSQSRLYYYSDLHRKSASSDDAPVECKTLPRGCTQQPMQARTRSSLSPQPPSPSTLPQQNTVKSMTFDERGFLVLVDKPQSPAQQPSVSSHFCDDEENIYESLDSPEAELPPKPRRGIKTNGSHQHRTSLPHPPIPTKPHYAPSPSTQTWCGSRRTPVRPNDPALCANLNPVMEPEYASPAVVVETGGRLSGSVDSGVVMFNEDEMERSPKGQGARQQTPPWLARAKEQRRRRMERVTEAQNISATSSHVTSPPASADFGDSSLQRRTKVMDLVNNFQKMQAMQTTL